jgi:hypothetical protein
MNQWPAFADPVFPSAPEVRGMGSIGARGIYITPDIRSPGPENRQENEPEKESLWKRIKAWFQKLLNELRNL